MKLKTMLLGSAVAPLVAVGANAADSVPMAEPEQVEYVRVCDTYGVGYYYIPGTEVCLRIGGYVRYQVSGGDFGSLAGAVAHDKLDGDLQGTWKSIARVGIQIQTGQETELGRLSTFFYYRMNWGNVFGTDTGPTEFPLWLFGYAQLGGLTVGKSHSAYNSFTGWAGRVEQDSLVPFGEFDTNLISYTFDAGNGFSAIASLETGSPRPYANLVKDAGGMWVPAMTTNEIDDYIPNVVVGAKYAKEWGGVSAVFGYTNAYEEWGAKARVDLNVSPQLQFFLMGGYGSEKNVARSFFKPWGGNWGVWAGANYAFNEKTRFNMQLSADEDRNGGLAAAISHDLVPGFTVTAELDYLREGNFGKPDHVGWTGATKRDNIGGMLSFQRNF